MKTRLFFAASALTLALMAPAIAQNYGAAQSNTGTVIAAETYSQIRVPVLEERLFGDDITHLTVDEKMTADAMIGEKIYGINGTELATIDDIIVNEDGLATMVIVARGGFLGMGQKLAAFDYNLVTRQDEAGDIIMPLGERTLEQAIDFSYDADDADEENTLVMPLTSYRLTDILDAELINPLGQEVAEAEDAILSNGRVEYVVFDLEDTTGIEDDQLAMPYSDLSKAILQGELDFQLTGNQARMLEEYIVRDISVR